MKHLLGYWNNTTRLPMLIKAGCRASMLIAPLFLFLLIVPVFDWTVNEREVPYRELWFCGAGPVFATFFALVGFGAWGAAARYPASRWGFVLAPILPVTLVWPLPSSWFTQEVALSASVLINGFITAVFIYICLFYIRGVREYFQVL